MSNPDLEANYIMVAVAPSNTVGTKLATLASDACASAGLRRPSDWRTLGRSNGWSAIEAEIILDEADVSAVRQSLSNAMPAPVDTALLPVAGRRKQLLIADMDSTMIQQECLDELAGYAGIKDEIAAITARAMAGELDFEGALTERVARLKGLSLDALSACYRERITLMPGGRTLVGTMAAQGAQCVLVSGGFTYFTSRVAEAIGFHAHQGNTLLDDGKVLTGEVGMPILGREAKLDALRRAAEEAGLDLSQTLAMGDGANDLAMIEAAGLGLAVHAKPLVAAAADAAIIHGDLTVALYYQGYTDEEIRWS